VRGFLRTSQKPPDNHQTFDHDHLVNNSNEVIMHLFEIIATDGTILPVFGDDFDEVATLFTAWHMVNREGELPDFEVRRRNPRWPGLNTQHLVEALARNTVGIGRYDRRKGWSIVSPLDRPEC
jgi:hypothetical protein